jgi:hypothetical protein
MASAESDLVRCYDDGHALHANIGLKRTQKTFENLTAASKSRKLPIQLGFKNMEGGTYQDVVLHEISQTTIEHDISVFLQYEFTKIRVERSLTMDWPGQENIQTLVRMAVPLFIFA